jgi:predicted nucleic acid-binding protein
MKNLRIYLDTSVINHLFAQDVRERQMITIRLFEHYLSKGKLDGFISNVVVYEIDQSPDREKKQLLIAAYRSHDIRLLKPDGAQVGELAKEYVERKIIPVRYMDDARHIATATIEEMDVLVIWDFKHMANVRIERLINLANQEMGYMYPLRITTPLEVMV